MKIGILTFHCAHNYGAVLQAYALQEIIKELGHEVEIIDYRPDFLLTPYKTFSLKNIFSGNIKSILKKMVSAFLTFPAKVKRRAKFNLFISTNLNSTSKSTGKIPENYDLYIIGSDQVWNHRLTKGFNDVYWGYFKTKIAAKKITYAASFGDALNSENELLFIQKALNNFDGISLREADYINLLKQFYKKEIYKVLDPTLLLNNNLWESVVIKPNISKKYVLVYQVMRSNETLRIAKGIAEQIDGTVIEIPAMISIKNLRNKYITTSPFEFIGWIKNASCVVTTSFHGTAFSIIFNKPFYTVNLADGSEKRAGDLLTSLNLNHRLISKESVIKFENIDYTNVGMKLQELQQNSIQYIENFLLK